MTRRDLDYTTKREVLIGQAVQHRKIAAERASDYRKMYDAMPEQVEHLLTAPVEQGGLMAGIVPGPTPLRFAPNLPASAGVAPAADGPTDYPAAWATPSGTGSIMFEDNSAKLEALTNHVPPRSGPGGAANINPRNVPGVTFE